MKYMELATRIALGTLEEDKNSFFGIIGIRNDGAMIVSSNVRTKSPCHSAHAEYRLLKKCDAGSTIWIVRILKNGNWAMAKPCVRCQSLIKNKRVNKVYYSISPGHYGVWNP